MNEPLQPPLDCLALGAHPDDAELFAGGTLALAIRAGRRVGVLDLTRGESATRGSAQTRAAEARAAGARLGLAVRETLDLGDGDLANTQANRAELIAALRRLRPRLILTHGPADRHPDHRRAHELVRDAAFLANVGGFAAGDGALGPRWAVEALAFFPGNDFQPDPPADWVVDVSETFALKCEVLRDYATQFASAAAGANGAGAGAETYIASAQFWEHLENRARVWGHRIGAAYGEPFLLDRPAHAAHPLVRLLAPA
jgi:bacillithiol biosynthesis deacetylase BshB1